MKKIIITCFAVLCGVCSFAADGWTTYYQNAAVKISYRISDCHDTHNGIHQQKVLFRFENTGTVKEQISFAKRAVYAKTAADDISSYQIELQPGQVLEGDCGTHDNRLFFFSKHLNFKGAELRHFDLKDLSVKPVE